MLFKRYGVHTICSVFECCILVRIGGGHFFFSRNFMNIEELGYIEKNETLFLLERGRKDHIGKPFYSL